MMNRVATMNAQPHPVCIAGEKSFCAFMNAVRCFSVLRFYDDVLHTA